MYQAKTTFHIVRDDGTEEVVRAGRVFLDSHPFVARDVSGELFEKLDDDDDIPAPRATARKASKP